MIESSEATHHSEIRLQQRGVRRPALEILLKHGDRHVHAGDGCESISLSRRVACGLIDAGYYSDDVGQAIKLVAVLGRRGVVSVIRPQAGRRGRGYRRQMPTRSAKRRVR